MLENYNDVLSTKEMREILQIGENTAYHLLKSGAIRSIKVGRKFRIPKAALLEYLAGDTSAVTNPNASLIPSAEQTDNR